MSNTLSRAGRCRPPAEGCRRVTTMALSTRMANDCRRTAEHHSWLADADESGRLAYGH